MHKKAQFYIFTVIILSALVMVLSLRGMETTPPEEVFDSLNENFIQEMHVVVNDAINNDKDLLTTINHHIDWFKDYAKTKNIDYEVFYALKIGNEMYLFNNMNEGLNIEASNIDLSLEENQKTETESTNWLKVTLDNNEYLFNMTESTSQAGLFRTIDKDNILIKTYGD
ncbi:hypothetical protein KY339_04915 [Candidatus Woesearchaeota archaeon]|nr:hypothetical protein [Candidatus Woesearchaeota archaeon]